MEQPLNPPPPPKTHPRNPWIALLLSIFTPGLGQVYNGQPVKGAIFFVLLLLLALVFGITRMVTSFGGFVAFVVIGLSIAIYFYVDAVRNANRQKQYVLKKYNTGYHYMTIIVLALGLHYMIDLPRRLGVKTFKIPTASGAPTTMVGDRFVADMKAYADKDPDYGDIVVFTRKNGVYYVFRVVGKPNDKLALKDNIVIINGKPGKATFIKDLETEGMAAKEFEEELPNGHKHRIYKFMQMHYTWMQNINDIEVPPNHYYLLGDSRDNAADSRLEGFVHRDSIKGRMIFTYFGKSMDRIGVDFRDK